MSVTASTGPARELVFLLGDFLNRDHFRPSAIVQMEPDEAVPVGPIEPVIARFREVTVSTAKFFFSWPWTNGAVHCPGRICTCPAVRPRCCTFVLYPRVALGGLWLPGQRWRQDREPSIGCPLGLANCR